jgi:hypothetical protein
MPTDKHNPNVHNSYHPRTHRHSPTYAVVALPKIRRKSHFAQVGIDYTYEQLYEYMYIERSPIEIQTPTHWNLNTHSMAAPFIPAKKTQHAFQKCYYFNVFIF